MKVGRGHEWLYDYLKMGRSSVTEQTDGEIWGGHG